MHKILIPCLKICHIPLWGQTSTEGVLWPEIFPERPFLKQCHITTWKACRGACSPRVLVQLGSICYSFLKTNGILMQCSVEKSKIMWTQACFPHWTWLSPPAAASGAFLKSLFYTLSWWRVSKAIAVTSSDPQRNCDTRNGDWNNSSFSCSPRQALRKDSHILSLYV